MAVSLLKRQTTVRSTFAVVAIILGLGSMTRAADTSAQTQTQTRSVHTNAISIPGLSGKSSMPRPVTADKDYAHDKLTTFIDLPDVPKYSGAGAIFIDGLKYPNDNFGQDITMSFGVMEQAAQVNDWYKAALQQYQWTMYPVKPNPAAADTYQIDAGKGKYNVGLMIKGVTRKPYRTRIVIRYKYGK